MNSGAGATSDFIDNTVTEAGVANLIEILKNPDKIPLTENTKEWVLKALEAYCKATAYNIYVDERLQIRDNRTDLTNIIKNKR